jgi:hypothetical protein
MIEYNKYKNCIICGENALYGIIFCKYHDDLFMKKDNKTNLNFYFMSKYMSIINTHKEIFENIMLFP